MPKNKLPKDVSKLSLRPPLVVQILAIIGYTGFSIPVAIIAMTQYGILGMFVVLLIIWGWSEVLNLGTKPTMNDIVDRLRPKTDETAASDTGNASFDAYKSELLTRLENEQANFKTFLARLREAKDKTEFDTFMEARERVAQERSSTEPA
ncbi:MAG: DUF2852 domain-containing protein [Pseudomonadota bacterium]